LTKSQLHIVLVLVLIQVLFGINFPASKIVVAKMDPFLWSNLRFLIAGFIMLVISLLSRRQHPRLNKDFLLPVFTLSLLGMALGQGLFLIGLAKTTSINSSIIITFIPILTLLIVILRKQETVTFNKCIGIIMSFMGVILMRNITQFNLSNSTFIGDIFVFLGALCFALYLSFGKKFFMKYDNLWSTTWMFLISGFVMSLFNLNKMSMLDLSSFDSEFYYCASFSILFATLLTYFLNNWALKHAPSAHVAVFIYLQPVVAGIIGFLYLGEIVTIRMFVSGMLIMSGLLFTLRKN